jgi:NiFe hydrogenase small subunit HydA
MGCLPHKTTTYDVLREHGIDRRKFVKFCTLMAAALGLEATVIPQIVEALETKPRLPVIWLHGLECTCCSESFIRSSHPIVQDVVLNMISLDYDDTLMAAAGVQAEDTRRRIMKTYAGEYILAVEGNAPMAACIARSEARLFLAFSKRRPPMRRQLLPGDRAPRTGVYRRPVRIRPAPSQFTN